MGGVAPIARSVSNTRTTNVNPHHQQHNRRPVSTFGFPAQRGPQRVQAYTLHESGNGSGEHAQENQSSHSEALQRKVLQLQAEHAELTAEITHLAAALRAALHTAPDHVSGVLDAADLQAYQLPCPEPLDSPEHLHMLNANNMGPQHDHTHLHLGSRDGWHAVGTGAPDGMAAFSAYEHDAAGAPIYHQPTSVSQATLSCSMQHPGSICCSKLSSALDPGGAACTVSLHTTARCTADGVTMRRHLDPEELRALAAHALVGAAHAFSQTATQEYRAHAAPPQAIAARHDGLVRALEHGIVVGAERTPPSQFDHRSYLLSLQDPNTALRVRAIFKPRCYGDSDGWHRVPMEYVAYRLNLLLGMDLVPPVAYRTAPLSLGVADEEEELVFQEGACMLWVENCRELREQPFHEWGVDPEVLLSDTRILDVLLHNSDRHHGHFLFGPHWARGHDHGGHWEGVAQPFLIDHAASFRREAVVSMEHENAFGTGAVRCVSAATYLRLRFLDSHTVAQELGQHLSRAEQRQLLHRRDYVLHYLDALVASQGYAATVRE